MKRTILKKDKSEKKKTEQGQFWKGNIRKRTILNRTNLKKNKSEKENLKTGNSAKGKP